MGCNLSIFFFLCFFFFYIDCGCDTRMKKQGHKTQILQTYLPHKFLTTHIVTYKWYNSLGRLFFNQSNLIENKQLIAISLNCTYISLANGIDPVRFWERVIITCHVVSQGNREVDIQARHVMALEVLISRTWFMRLSMACMQPHSYFADIQFVGLALLINQPLCSFGLEE